MSRLRLTRARPASAWHRRLVGAALLAGAGVTVLASPAVAQVQGALLEVEVHGQTMHVSFSAADGSTPVNVTAAGLTVRFQPGAGPAQNLPVRPVPPDPQTVILALDTSQRMGSTAVQAEQRAAGAFLDALPPGVRVGLVTFGGTAHLVVPPQAERAAIRQALTSMTASGTSHLYDAVVTAAAARVGVRRDPHDGPRLGAPARPAISRDSQLTAHHIRGVEHGLRGDPAHDRDRQAPVDVMLVVSAAANGYTVPPTFTPPRATRSTSCPSTIRPRSG